MLLETDKKVLGEKIRKYRKLKNLTQFELAELVNLHERQISRIEMGLNYPTYMTFAKLIEALDINISELMVNEEFKLNQIQEDLIGIINGASVSEQRIFRDIIKILKKDLKGVIFDIKSS